MGLSEKQRVCTQIKGKFPSLADAFVYRTSERLSVEPLLFFQHQFKLNMFKSCQPRPHLPSLVTVSIGQTVTNIAGAIEGRLSEVV